MRGRARGRSPSASRDPRAAAVVRRPSAAATAAATGRGAASRYLASTISRTVSSGGEPKPDAAVAARRLSDGRLPAARHHRLVLRIRPLARRRSRREEDHVTPRRDRRLACKRRAIGLHLRRRVAPPRVPPRRAHRSRQRGRVRRRGGGFAYRARRRRAPRVGRQHCRRDRSAGHGRAAPAQHRRVDRRRGQLDNRRRAGLRRDGNLGDGPRCSAWACPAMPAGLLRRRTLRAVWCGLRVYGAGQVLAH